MNNYIRRLLLTQCKDKDSIEWHILVSDFLFHKFKNPFLAYAILKGTQYFNLVSIKNQFWIYKIRKWIISVINPPKLTLQRDNFVMKVITVERNLEKIKASMFKILKQNKAMWTDFKGYNNMDFKYLVAHFEVRRCNGRRC